MTETKKAEKTETKETKMSPGQELREKRGLLTALRKDIDQQAAILKNTHNEAQAAVLSIRQKAVKDIKEKAEKEKEGHKTKYDTSRDAALKEYEASLEAITKKRDGDISDAHMMKETAYRAINERVEKESAPFIEAHRDEMAALTKKYEKDAAEHQRSGAEAVKTLQGEIEALEQELAKRAEKNQKVAKPAAEPATA